MRESAAFKIAGKLRGTPTDNGLKNGTNRLHSCDQQLRYTCPAELQTAG